MPTVEERIASLEARMDAIADLRNMMIELRVDVNRRFDHVDRRFEGLDQKVDRHFMWLVGTQSALLVAAFGWLLTVWTR